MALDTSIYANLRPVQMDFGSPMETIARAMSLGEMGMKTRALQQELQEKDAVRSAIAGATQDGVTDWSQALGTMGTTAPGQVMPYATKIAEMNKAELERKDAMMASALKHQEIVGNALEAMKGLNEEQRAAAWAPAIAGLTKQGVITPQMGVPTEYNKEFFDNAVKAHEATSAFLDTQLKKANLASTEATTKKTIAETNSDAFKFKLLPQENQDQIKKIAEDSANKLSIAGQIDASVAQLKDPNITPDQKLMQARQMIKVLNSTQGKDAVGAEEAKRLASMLEYHIANFTEPGAFMGRDVQGFATQAALTARSLRQSIQTNDGMVNELKTGKPVRNVVPTVEQTTGLTDGMKQLAKAGPAPKGGAGVVESKAEAAETKGGAHPQDSAAVAWAKAHPKDPRSSKILKLNGGS